MTTPPTPPTLPTFAVRAVLIDLDGTLVDTVQDIAVAVNAMRAEHGRTALDIATVRSYIGRGTVNLVRRCFAPDDAPATALDGFRRHYQASNGRQAQVYPGVAEGLSHLRNLGLKLACVTNKPTAFVHPLLQQTGLHAAFDLILCGDTLPRNKPDPLPLHHACTQFGIAPQQALMIGDSMNDVQAARAAGCPVVCVPYGYTEGQPLRATDCDAIVPTIAAAARQIVAAPALCS